jgi:hypothetical protein
MKKKKQSLGLAPLKLLTTTFRKISLGTRFKDPKAAILTLKMVTGSRL